MKGAAMRDRPFASGAGFLVSFAFVVLSVGNATAHEEVFTATLTNAAENPPIGIVGSGVAPDRELKTSSGAPRPASFGNATFVLNDTQTAMTMTATVTNIDVNGLQTPNDTNDNLVAAHIHASATVTPTTNTGVVWGFFGSPDSNVPPMDYVLTPFASGVGGTFTSTWNMNEGNGGTTLTAQIENILNGRAYLNFHTTQFGGGEVRAHLVPIPEPSTIVLAVMGAAGLGLVTIKRRRSAK
jgi:hypothetical protein